MTPSGSELAEIAVQRLRAGQRVRRRVDGGRLHIDRPLPFICVVRRSDSDPPGTEELVHGQGSYLICRADPAAWGEHHCLMLAVMRELTDAYGSVLVVELWPGPPRDGATAGTFRIQACREDARSTTVDVLCDALGSMRVGGTSLGAEVVVTDAPTRPGLDPVLTPDDVRKLGCVVVAIEVPPVLHDPQSGERYPVLFRAFQRDFSAALHRSFFDFADVQTSFPATDFRALGRREVVEAARESDLMLVEVAEELNFLVMITPVNVDEAWEQFQEGDLGVEPAFHYRPLRTDPDELKRRLFEVPIDRVEDPTLAALFRAKRRELDRLVSMLEDRDSPAFLGGSLQVYGSADERLKVLAGTILEGLGGRFPRREPGPVLHAGEFAARARTEIEAYRSSFDGVGCRVEIRDDIPGVMVSEGNLLVGANIRVPGSRAEALIQHEVGTHVVTYVNGHQQPLRQLQTGLPGCEETQEGLAVVAEYLVGGLDGPRLALLGARVLAVSAMTEGASFVETFRLLHRSLGMGPREAFTVAMRVHRSGGLTKDVIYLRGLNELVAYVDHEHDLEPLLMGKLPLDHVEVIQELSWRGVLNPAVLRPRWMDHPEARSRLSTLRQADSVLDLAVELSA